MPDSTQADRIRALEAQRDELLAALEAVDEASIKSDHAAQTVYLSMRVIGGMRAAIRKAREGA